MAWTRAKMAVAGGVALLLATTGTMTVSHYLNPPPPKQTGRFHLPTGNVKPMIGAGNGFRVILASDGSLWSCGEEPQGFPSLGLSDIGIHNTVPLRRIGNETNWVAVSSASALTIALKADGTLWGWGENHHGQLGANPRVQPHLSPINADSDWAQIAAGGAWVMALKKNGTLWAWGNNWAGQLGLGTTKETPEPAPVGNSTNWTKVWAHASGVQTVGQQADGSLWYWGSLTRDSKDNASKVSVPTRVSSDTNWIDVCFGDRSVFAIQSDGSLWCWGADAPFYAEKQDSTSLLTPRRIGPDKDWQACASDGGFYSLLKKREGSIWMMNAGDPGHQLNKSDRLNIQKIQLPADATTFVSWSNGGIVLTRDGEVWSWGRVYGEHPPKDYDARKSSPPNFRVLEKPWRRAVIDPSREGNPDVRE